MKIAIIVGTRPEIIKMSPVIRKCEHLRSDYFILHTGQHYSYNMDKVFFEQLELPDAKYNYLFAPTEKVKKILLSEGIPAEKINVTGNTVVYAVFQNLEIANERANVLDELHLEPENYFLVTAHRQENVDIKERFGGIINGLELVVDEFGLPVIYPIHPRARKMMNHFGLNSNGIELIESVDYLSFLQLEAKAKLVLTDSGGVQEETCILGVPCVTLRDNTERPETLEAGSNILAGTNAESILSKTNEMLDRNNNWKDPFGDGTAGKRIVRILERECK